MRYVVDVGGEKTSVELENARATTASGEGASLASATGTPSIRTLRVGDRVVRIVIRSRGARGEYVLDIEGHRYVTEALDERTRTIREMSARSAAPKGPAPVTAPMPGLVTRVRVAVGDRVEAGQGVVVMEAMKMENELKASSAGTVKSVRIEPGTAVEKGTVLIELE